MRQFIISIKRHKKLIAGAIVIIFLLAAFLIIRTVNSPADGTVKTTSTSTVPEVVQDNKDFTNNFFTTKYPGRYELIQNQNASASLASWVLLARQSIGGQLSAKIAITITNLPVGGVKEDSAYKQFEAFPEKYKITPMIYDNEQVITAEKLNQGYEHTALWPHGKYLATISMTTQEKNDRLVSEFELLLSHLNWVD